MRCVMPARLNNLLVASVAWLACRPFPTRICASPHTLPAARGGPDPNPARPGASAQLADQRVMVGSARLLGIDGRSPLAEQAETHAVRGETVVWVGWERMVAGFVALRDEPSPTPGAALRLLEMDGLHPVILSGDDPRTMDAIAAELGVAITAKTVARSGCRSKVLVEMIPCQSFSTFLPADPLPGRTAWQ
jgi:hypothetical protein